MARMCSINDAHGCPVIMTLMKQQGPHMPDRKKRLLRAKMNTLLALGADVNGQDFETGNTAAHLAVLQRDTQTLQLLQTFRVDFSRSNHKQQKPFECDEGAFRKSVQQILKLDEYERQCADAIEQARNVLLDAPTADLPKAMEKILRTTPFFRIHQHAPVGSGADASVGAEGRDTRSSPAHEATNTSHGRHGRRVGNDVVGAGDHGSENDDDSDGPDGQAPRARRRASDSGAAASARGGGGEATPFAAPKQVTTAYLASLADADGNSLLITAVNQRLHADRVPMLLRLGADPNFADHFGCTALHHVCKPANQNPQSFAALLEAGAVPSLKDGEKRSVAALISRPHSIAHQASQKTLQSILDKYEQCVSSSASAERTNSPMPAGDIDDSSPFTAWMSSTVMAKHIVAAREALSQFVKASNVADTEVALQDLDVICGSVAEKLRGIGVPRQESEADQTPRGVSPNSVELTSSNASSAAPQSSSAPVQQPEIAIQVPLTVDNEEVESVEDGQVVVVSPAAGARVKDLLYQVAEQFNRQLWKSGSVHVSSSPTDGLDGSEALDLDAKLEDTPILKSGRARRRVFLVLDDDDSSSDSDSDGWGDDDSVDSDVEIGVDHEAASEAALSTDVRQYDHEEEFHMDSPLLKKPRLTRQSSAHGTAIEFFSHHDMYERSRDKEKKYLEENALPEWWPLERIRAGLLVHKDSFASKYFDDAEGILAALRFKVLEPTTADALYGDEEQECEVCQMGEQTSPGLEFIESNTCGHRVCKPCMTRYCSINVTNNSFVDVRCPAGDCGEPLTHEIISQCLDENEMEKFHLWVARKYMETSQHLRECHTDGCSTFIEYHNDYSTQPIICATCANVSCWQCGAEAHTPAACQLAEKWFEEIGEDVQEKMLASKCKQCPKCKARIYIDDKVACNHMTCVCGHHFCWLCMDPWNGHSGDYYSCNKFNELRSKADTKVKDAQSKFEKAVNQRKFFEHCFNRYLAHDLAFQATSKHLPERVRRCMEKAAEKFDLSEYKLQFMMDCAKELRLCRLALKWSYPYVYCMKEVDLHHFHVVEAQQAKLEKYTDLLHEAMADIEITPSGSITGKSELVAIFTKKSTTQRAFNDFRTKIMHECEAIRQFRRGLCESAQNDARKIQWEKVSLGSAAKNYEGNGKWLNVQGHQ